MVIAQQPAAGAWVAHWDNVVIHFTELRDDERADG